MNNPPASAWRARRWRVTFAGDVLDARIVAALITLGGTLFVAWWQGWIGGHTARAQKASREHDAKLARYSALVDARIREGVGLFVADLGIADSQQRADTIEYFVRAVKPMMEVHLVSSLEVIRATMVSGRATLQGINPNVYGLGTLRALDRFISWSVPQISVLLAARVDLGGIPAETADLRRAWDEHLAAMRDWVQKTATAVQRAAAANVTGS